MTIEQQTIKTQEQLNAANAAINGTTATTTTKAPELPERNEAGMRKETFFFRPQTVKGADGKPVMGEYGKPLKEPARAPFITYLPYIAKLADGGENKLVSLLQDEGKSGKTIDYLAELVNNEIHSIAQNQINAAIAAGKDLTDNVLNYAALDLWALINKSGGISKELWVEFKTDIQTVLTSQFGVSISGAENVARFLGDDKLVTVKTALGHLNKLSGYLNAWFDKTSEENQAKFLPVYKFLNDRATLYIKGVDAFNID
jgi:hypothetical protein